MSARLLEGRPLSEKIREQLRAKIAASGKKLTLASVQVGQDPGTDVYIKAQAKCAGQLGIEHQLHTLDRDTSQERLIEFIHSLNRNICVNGIILHLPLPPQVDYRTVSAHIDPRKDVEGMCPANLGALLSNAPKIIPCTAASAMELILSTGIDLAGKEAVIVGHSAIIGKPLALLLLDRLATVTVCHIGTSRARMLETHVRRAQVLVVATGKPGLIPGSWIREDSIVVDVGINCVCGKLAGDVVFDEARERAAWITPVPGGVGPLTVTMLMRNLVDAYL